MPRRELNPGDRVALSTPGDGIYVDVVLGLLERGIFPIPLDPALTPTERERILAPLDPQLLVTDTPGLNELRERHPWRGGIPRGRPIHCTSGTTGTPKGVFSGLLPSNQAAALVEEERDLWGFHSDDVNLVLSPLHHSAPLRFAVGTRLAGGRVVIAGRFDAQRITEVIDEQRPTSMFCVPTHLQRLFRHWEVVGAPDVSSFRLVAHAGAPCPVWVKERLIETFPASSTWEFYGSTEGQFTACQSEEWLVRPGTVGRARPGRTMTADEDGHLWCVVPEHARFTYYGDPDKTAQAWRTTPQGPAFTVGDVGRVDEDGYVFLDGRRTDLIISGGVNVYPLEVENALRELPGVEDVAVFGRPDDDWGQAVVAAVIGTATADELDRAARERLAPAKRPKAYVFLEELPRNATGKVLRDELSARAQG